MWTTFGPPGLRWKSLPKNDWTINAKWCSVPQTESHQGINFNEICRSTVAYVKKAVKNRKSKLCDRWRKNTKKHYTKARMKNETHFTLWGFNSDYQDILKSFHLHLAQNMIFLNFKIFQANVRCEKGCTFMVGPEQHLAMPRHCFLVTGIKLTPSWKSQHKHFEKSISQQTQIQ